VARQQVQKVQQVQRKVRRPLVRRGARRMRVALALAKAVRVVVAVVVRVALGMEAVLRPVVVRRWSPLLRSLVERAKQPRSGRMASCLVKLSTVFVLRARAVCHGMLLSKRNRVPHLSCSKD